MKSILTYIRAFLCGFVLNMMGFPVFKNGTVNWGSIFILFIFIGLFIITDEVAKKSE